MIEERKHARHAARLLDNADDMVEVRDRRTCNGMVGAPVARGRFATPARTAGGRQESSARSSNSPHKAQTA